MLQWRGWFPRVTQCAPPSVDQFVGTKLHTIRTKWGETPEAVGALLSLSTNEIGRMEAGRKRISASQLFLLANYFNVPVAAFFDRRGDLA